MVVESSVVVVVVALPHCSSGSGDLFPWSFFAIFPFRLLATTLFLCPFSSPSTAHYRLPVPFQSSLLVALHPVRFSHSPSCRSSHARPPSPFLSSTSPRPHYSHSCHGPPRHSSHAWPFPCPPFLFPFPFPLSPWHRLPGPPRGALWGWVPFRSPVSLPPLAPS